jgi:hypothetical protein
MKVTKENLTMTSNITNPQHVVFVVIDIAKSRNDVLVQLPEGAEKI